MKLGQILNEIQKLSEKDKLLLINTLLSSVIHQGGGSKKKRKVTDLAGLGKEIWMEVNVEEYIRNERNWD